MIALFLIHEVLRWFAPWGSWLGGPGFTYQRVEDDSGSTEMKDFSPENKIPWMNKRAPQVRVHSNPDASRNQSLSPLQPSVGAHTRFCTIPATAAGGEGVSVDPAGGLGRDHHRPVDRHGRRHRREGMLPPLHSQRSHDTDAYVVAARTLACPLTLYRTSHSQDINDPNDSYDSTCVIGTKFQ
jgi:hypothetical protein